MIVVDGDRILNMEVWEYMEYKRQLGEIKTIWTV